MHRPRATPEPKLSTSVALKCWFQTVQHFFLFFFLFVSFSFLFYSAETHFMCSPRGVRQAGRLAGSGSGAGRKASEKKRKHKTHLQTTTSQPLPSAGMFNPDFSCKHDKCDLAKRGGLLRRGRRKRLIFLLRTEKKSHLQSKMRSFEQSYMFSSLTDKTPTGLDACL